MATITVQTISRDGLAYTTESADVDGDSFANTGKEFLLVTNDGESSCVVTVPITKTVDSQAVTSRTVTVSAATSQLVGSFPVESYSKSVSVSYDQVTSVTVALLKVGT